MTLDSIFFDVEEVNPFVWHWRMIAKYAEGVTAIISKSRDSFQSCQMAMNAAEQVARKVTGQKQVIIYPLPVKITERVAQQHAAPIHRIAHDKQPQPRADFL